MLKIHPNRSAEEYSLLLANNIMYVVSAYCMIFPSFPVVD